MEAEPGTDVLATAFWECAPAPAGEVAGPDALDAAALGWIRASVPGTVAGAQRTAGVEERSSIELDGQDWWYRCRFAGPRRGGAGPHLLEIEGVATVSDVWLNGVHLSSSTSMFAQRRVRLGAVPDRNELVIRCAALGPLLVSRRPRPRWKTAGASSQSLRWFRTTLLGRQPGWVVTPAPVGPWRPVRLVPLTGPHLVDRRLVATCGSEGAGSVDVELDWALPDGGPEPPAGFTLEVGGSTAPLDALATGDRLQASGGVAVPGIERWWPHTHGPAPLYPVTVRCGDARWPVGSVGFRTVEVDRRDGAFSLAVNGVDVFCRGGCWYPVDPVTLAADEGETEETLALVRRAGMNMVRIPGGTVYPPPSFYALCDRLGIMVWQDTMLGMVDPPDDRDFERTVADEVTVLLREAAAHPSLSVVCGGQELEEQPAMFGLPRERWTSPVTDGVIAERSATLAPGIPYLTSSPTGGALPFQVDEGVSHYTGVGVFMRPLDDLRRSAPRFVSEGLAFAQPPDRVTVDEAFAGARAAGHDPGWKRAVHHDTGGSWDLEDVRDFYAQMLFGEDMRVLRRRNPERALDLGRATVAHVVEAAACEWRRRDSPCSGLLLVGLRDLRVGAGWGIVDGLGRPKSAWYSLSRLLQPLGVLVTDEGLNGLAVHLVNDGPVPCSSRLTVELFGAEHRLEEAGGPVEIPARGALEVRADALFDGFRDLTYAYQFGPRPYEVVRIRLVDGDGTELAGAHYLPGGLGRPVHREVGLQADVGPADGDVWALTVSSRDFAQFVHVEVPGFRAADSWFHLAPGASVITTLVPEADAAAEGPVSSPGPGPRGQARALNSVVAARIAP